MPQLSSHWIISYEENQLCRGIRIKTMWWSREAVYNVKRTVFCLLCWWPR